MNGITPYCGAAPYYSTEKREAKGGSFGCSDFSFQTGKEEIFCARSMDFYIKMKSDFHVYCRGEIRESLAPDGSKGLSWVSKYGYMGVNAFGIDDPVEGLNEQGLSFGFLTLRCSEYQTVSEEQKCEALAIHQCWRLDLGQF